MKNNTGTNVYQMYVNNGNKAGFYVQRTNSKYSRVDSIGGQTEGKLEGNPPYFNNQKVAVTEFSLYNRYTNDFIGDEFLRCPGTYQYSLVDEDGN